MVLKKFLSHLIYGTSEIDLVLERDTYRMGETATGKVRITAGQTGATIQDLRVQLRVKSAYDDRDEKRVIVDEVIAEVAWDQRFDLQSNERVELDFAMKIPEPIPVSSLNTGYYLKTNLDVAEGHDPEDTDLITVLPSGLLHHFLAAFEQLGCQVCAESYLGNRGYQGFYFHNTTWMAGLLDELEFILNPYQTGESIRVFYEVEKKTDDVRIDDLDLNEKKGVHTFSAEDLASVEKAVASVKGLVERDYRKLQG